MKAGFPHLVLVLTFLVAVAGRIALTVALAVLRSRMSIMRHVFNCREPLHQFRFVFDTVELSKC